MGVSAMPIYEYRCQQCNSVFSRLFQRPLEASGPQACSICGSVRTQRVVSTFAIGGRVNPGPGRAAWPTSWNDTNGGDPETLNYWRHRIEREARLEEKYPELRDPSLLNGKGTVENAPGTVGHSHDDHHHHHHHHHHAHPHNDPTAPG
jgi:putative FmdB family regulatory protein